MKKQERIEELEAEVAALREEVKLSTDLGWSAVKAMQKQRDKAAAKAWYEGFDAGRLTDHLRATNPNDSRCKWYWDETVEGGVTPV